MQIYAINNINFTAKNSFIKTPPKIDPEILGKIKNNVKDDIRKDLYNNIDAYISKKFTKKEFLLSLNKFAHKIDNKVKLNDAEKQYIDDMLTTIDLSGKSAKISDSYILDNISELIKNQ